MAGLTDLGRINNVYYSTYRPIVAEFMDNDADTAFVRGELYIETTPGATTYVSTGILINAYEKSNPYTSNRSFEFNLMEYCRNFVSPGLCPIVSANTNQLAGRYETASFFLKVWPVKYSQTTVGGLYDDDGSPLETNTFIGVGTTTHDEDGLDAFDGYIKMNRFVLGKNSPWTEADTAMPLTDKPIAWNASTISGGRSGTYTINVNDYPCDSLYSPVAIGEGRNQVSMNLIVIDLNGVGTVHTIPLGTSTMNYRVPLAPEYIEYLHLMHTGTALNQIIDVSGALVARGILVNLTLHNNSGSITTPWQNLNPETGMNEWRWEYVEYSDQKNNGHCERTKFVFKNMRGGFDFFNCYGTQSKEAEVGGTDFDNHVTTSQRGYHGRKQLWTTREDIFKVFSQPLVKKECDWIQQLITSPQVWVQRELKNIDSSSRSNKSFLQPILIDKGSYAVHNTDDNVSFIEFKYRYSNPITTQRG